jgi:hypothetical protein
LSFTHTPLAIIETTAELSESGPIGLDIKSEGLVYSSKKRKIPERTHLGRNLLGDGSSALVNSADPVGAGRADEERLIVSMQVRTSTAIVAVVTPNAFPVPEAVQEPEGLPSKTQSVTTKGEAVVAVRNVGTGEFP